MIVDGESHDATASLISDWCWKGYIRLIFCRKCWVRIKRNIKLVEIKKEKKTEADCNKDVN